jgi:hypothetical protein
MEQTYTPNINISSKPGWCLQYVDDAGQAPNRTDSAKIAFNNEKSAGRICTDTIPENVWLVGWLDFTKGANTQYGHVFFIKRSGNSYELHDSDVHAGLRKPYTSIDDMLRWFGAQAPVYIGWSTNCDGREYAKENSMDKVTKEIEQICEFGILGRNGLSGRTNALTGQGNINGNIGRDLNIHYIRELFYSSEAKKYRDGDDKVFGSNKNIQKRLNERDKLEKENKQLKERIKELEAGGGSFTQLKPGKYEVK